MPDPDSLDRTLRAELDRQITALARGRGRPKVPAPLGLMRPGGLRHFHFSPEVFLQLSGCTDFSFPHGRLRLGPGELAVLAVGLPHAERARPWQGPFRNLVIMLGPATVSWHEAERDGQGRPRSGAARVVPTAEAPRLAGYLNDLVEAAHAPGPAQEAGVRGLLLAFLAAVRRLLEGPVPARPREPYKVVQCRHHVMRWIADPGLNVRKLAARLGCTPDYLSFLFHRETGVTLIATIQRQRVAQARALLETSPLNIEEVGRAVGYEDPGYFARVFKRLAGQTPGQYRRARAAGAGLPEEPFTIG